MCYTSVLGKHGGEDFGPVSWQRKKTLLASRILNDHFQLSTLCPMVASLIDNRSKNSKERILSGVPTYDTRRGSTWFGIPFLRKAILETNDSTLKLEAETHSVLRSIPPQWFQQSTRKLQEKWGKSVLSNSDYVEKVVFPPQDDCANHDFRKKKEWLEVSFLFVVTVFEGSSPGRHWFLRCCY